MPACILERLIAGGRTGIGQLGLEVAQPLGITTGGVAPKGLFIEDIQEGENSLVYPPAVIDTINSPDSAET